MTKPFFCICLLQLGYLLKSMYISLLLIMSVSVTLDTRATEILKSKSVRSTDDVDIRT